MSRKIGEVSVRVVGEEAVRSWDVFDCGCSAISVNTQLRRAETKRVRELQSKGFEIASSHITKLVS